MLSWFDIEVYGIVLYEFVVVYFEILVDKIGILGILFGGYYVLWIVVNELCFVLGFVWGVNYNWVEV